MADFNNLKAAIRAAIYENEDQAITGDALQEVLLEMVDEVNGEKQDAIADLDAIRAGAAKGDTAVQNVKSLGGQALEGDGNIEVELTTNAGTPNKLRLKFGADTISSQEFKTINGASIIGEGDIIIDTAALVRHTHAEMVALRDAGRLVPGRWYRITDYVATTTQEETRSANHPFDIVALAVAPNKLSEVCRAMAHEGDTHFAQYNAHLEGWQVWYSLDNNSALYGWADETNGKGVIYRLIDEWNNDLPFDFKGIQFHRTKAWADDHADWVHSRKWDASGGFWAYAFTWIDENKQAIDLTLIGNGYLYNDEGGKCWCVNNRTGIYGDYSGELLTLLNNLFIYDAFYDSGLFYGCYGNTFGNGCYGNTFGNDCSGNTFGNGCYGNTFGNGCSGDTFGNGCYGNTFGYGCSGNTFGNDCYGNTFGNDCSGNTFGNGCRYCRVMTGVKNVRPIPFDASKDNEQVAGLKSDGTLRIWNIADVETT